MKYRFYMLIATRNYQAGILKQVKLTIESAKEIKPEHEDNVEDGMGEKNCL